MARMMSSWGLPGGPLTFANMNPAAQLGLVGVRSARAAGPRRRRKAKATRKARSVTKRKTYRTKPARLVKGSAEAKRYMASIRKRRKRR